MFRTIARYVFAVLCAVLIITSCTTTRETTRTITKHDTLHIIQRDTLRKTILQRDSIIIRDSIYQQGATLVKERWRERWHVTRDTIRATRVDTIYRAKHSTQDTRQKVTTQRPWWQGIPPLMVIVAFIAFALYFGAKRYTR